MYNISELINFESIQKLKILNYFIFGASTVAQCFYAYLIIQCSTKQMQSFRIFMLAYVFFAFLGEAVLFLFKPVRLFPFNVIIPVGPLAPVSSSAVTGGTLILGPLSFFLMIDAITGMMMERHFQIIKPSPTNSSSKFRFQKLLIYGFLILSLVIMEASKINFFFANLDDSEARKVLTRNVENAEILLAHQNSLFIYKFSWNFDLIMLILTILFAFFYRIGIAVWLMKHHFKYPESINLSLSKQTIKHFNLMFQTTLAQLVVTTPCTIPMFIWGILIFYPAENLQNLHLILLELVQVYPLFDVIVVIIVVKPYRNLVKDMMMLKCLSKNNNVISLKKRSRPSYIIYK